MIIINADDWGRSRLETNTALECSAKGSITSVSAMVFMKDSERAAALAKEAGLAVGLHLNLNERFTGSGVSAGLMEQQQSVARFLNRSKYSRTLYHPLLASKLDFVYRAQVEEFVRLYGKAPTHFDGHHHLHLCMNMLLGLVVPLGLKVRRSFSFWPGEKGFLKRSYHSAVNRWLCRRYVVTDYFFSFAQCVASQRMEIIGKLARDATVELMTHPAISQECSHLQSDVCLKWLEKVPKGSYAELERQPGVTPRNGKVDLFLLDRSRFSRIDTWS